MKTCHISAKPQTYSIIPPSWFFHQIPDNPPAQIWKKKTMKKKTQINITCQIFFLDVSWCMSCLYGLNTTLLYCQCQKQYNTFLLPVWCSQRPTRGCPSASPCRSGRAGAWTPLPPACCTSPPDGSLGWSCGCPPPARATLQPVPGSAIERNVWQCQRPVQGSSGQASPPARRIWPDRSPPLQGSLGLDLIAQGRGTGEIFNTTHQLERGCLSMW